MSDEFDRRTFLSGLATTAVAACAACAGCPLAALAVGDRDRPAAAGDDDDDASSSPAAGPVDAGTLDDYPRDGVYDARAKSHDFFVVRHKGVLYALSATCTHKKTLLKVKGKAIACPKHGARFAIDGDVVKAPAKRALPRHAIARDDAGRITVDTSRTFDKKERGDAASFLRVD
jgi:nitrite reductase/ring-hydroxylating ferredoxin subunit